VSAAEQATEQARAGARDHADRRTVLQALDSPAPAALPDGWEVTGLTGPVPTYKHPASGDVPAVYADKRGVELHGVELEPNDALTLAVRLTEAAIICIRAR
jgi:hypothetical protein